MATKTKTEAKTETIQLNPTRDPRRLTCYRRFEDEREEIAKVRRRGRKTHANVFRDEYFYCRCQDNKTCIWYGDRICAHSWSDQSCGVTWAGVHGKNSICVVTKTGDLDVSRVHGFAILDLADEVFRNFRRAVISELEDLADPSSELRRKLDQSMKRGMRPKSIKHRKFDKSIKAPFGVVSVAPLPDKDHKASCVYEDTKFIKLKVEGIIKEMEGASITDESEIESDFDEDDEDARLKYEVKLTRRSWRNAPEIDTGYGEPRKTVRAVKKEMENEEMNRAKALTMDGSVEESSGKFDDKNAVEFLQKKMKKPGDNFTLEETVKTAISTFQRLCNKNFNASEIEVSVMDPDYFVLASESELKDIYVKHLETVEIDKYLSDIKDQEEFMEKDTLF